MYDIKIRNTKKDKNMLNIIKKYIEKSNILMNIFMCFLITISLIFGYKEMTILGLIFVGLLMIGYVLTTIIKILMLLGIISEIE